MDTPHSRDSANQDSRDNRTTQGPTPLPIQNRDVEDETRTLAQASDPVNAADPAASPSSYSLRDYDEGRTPMDQDLMRMVDPSIKGEPPVSTNPDVLNLSDRWLVESEEADFMGDPGTDDVIEVIEEGETYFPPTDPVLRAAGFNNAEMLGGFSITSLEEPTEIEDIPPAAQGNDDEIAQRVRYALATDAYTTDLNIEVVVEDGIVYLHGQVGSLNDTDQAEQIAGSVEGVVDVEEELEIV